MKSKADAYTIRLRSPKLTISDIRIFHRSIYRPAMLYSLPAVAVDEECFAPVQTKILASILNGIGVGQFPPPFAMVLCQWAVLISLIYVPKPGSLQ